jgi:alpha-L-fucosidase 2
MVGEGMPLSHGHRHWSNLFPIFPLYELRWDDPAQRSLINSSVLW